MGIRETNLAWIAGFLDGEGSIMITRTSQKTVSWGGRGLRLAVVASQIKSVESESVLRQLSEQYGGSVHRVKRSYGDYRYWFWQVTGYRATELLRDVLPYLRLKRRQARDGLRFAAIRQKYAPMGYHSRHLPDKARRAMEHLYGRMRVYNRPEADRP